MDSQLESLIKRLSRLPGLGPRSARRAALFLLQNRDRLMLPLAEELSTVARTSRNCAECGNLDNADICSLCRDTQRDRRMLCVVEDVGDLWAMERAAVFRGIYHVLGGTLSAIDGRGPQDLNIDRLVSRASSGVEEVILALSATVEGQTTAHYLHERLSSLPIEVTRLAHGVPVGGELDFLDDGTLAQALKARSKLG
ncbi:MAG: recombination protein RecR [Bacteroidetes bacterium]|jgi:recombination protein RecR|nr:recombination protein RecR [Bacteroidota bacterium]